MINITDFPENVLQIITNHLDINSKKNFSFTNHYIFYSIIQSLYHTIIYEPILYSTTNGNSEELSFAQTNNHCTNNSITILTNSNIEKFIHSISVPSKLGFYYSNFIVYLYLEKLVDTQIFDLPRWRTSEYFPIFQNLKKYHFPENIKILPLTYENAQNLDTIIVDYNFCDFLDFNKGSIEFFNHHNIKNLYFKGNLGKNEDIVIFKLITKFPHMIKHLSQLHFLVNSNENYEIVYRRIVGFFAILRKMGIVLTNLHTLTLSLTNTSSSAVLSLIGKHIIFENLTNFSILIQDDGKVLTLVKSLDKLSTIIQHHGFNINKLLIKYDLVTEDIDKNHLRSMMLLKFCESFRNLLQINLDLNIDGLSFSNLLMVLGSPIANNLNSLYDVRINVHQPSENLIGNIIPTLEDAIQLFPHLNFLNNCLCTICSSILEKLSLTSTTTSVLFEETIKVSTLLIIGQELDLVQKDCNYSVNSNSIINPIARFLRLNNYNKNGYLFDHLIKNQLNTSLSYLPNLQYFEMCGLVYTRSHKNILTSKPSFNEDIDMVDDDDNDDEYNDEKTAIKPNLQLNGFNLLYGNEFQGLDSNILMNISDLSQMFTGNL